MGDLNNQRWLVDPNKEVEKKWVECQIQERKSKIAKLNQDIEDLLKGRVVELEAQIMMNEMELKSLEEKYGNIKNSIDIK